MVIDPSSSSFSRCDDGDDDGGASYLSSSSGPPSGAAPTVDVTIANGQVKPTNVTLQAKVNQQITFHVTSDAKDASSLRNADGLNLRSVVLDDGNAKAAPRVEVVAVVLYRCGSL